MEPQNNSLRGGGAGKSSSKMRQQQDIQQQTQLLKSIIEHQESNFMDELWKCIKIVEENTDKLSTQEINKALQFIFLNEHVLHQMITDQKKNKRMVVIIIEQTNQWLLSTLKIIKWDTHIISKFLQVISLFLRIIFTFYQLNDGRVMEQSIINKWQQMIEQIEQEIKIENITGCYKNQIDYELFVISSIVQILKTDSNEGKLILKDLFSGIIKAVASFPSLSINNTIMDALARAVNYIVYQKIKVDVLDTYSIIYAIESYKCKFYNIITQQILEGQLTFDDAINEVINLFKQLNVQKYWQTLYCWIRMIEILITNQGRIVIKGKDELIDNSFIILDQSNGNTYLKTDKNTLLLDKNEQLIKTHFKGFDNIPIFYQGLIMGEQNLPQLDLYKLITKVSKDEKVETNPMRIFIKQIQQDLKIEFNRIKQFDLNTRLIKFQNQCLIKTDINSLTLEYIYKFYQPKLSQLDIIIEIMQLQQYFFYHSFIFYSLNIDHKKENPVLQKFKTKQEDVTNKINELTYNLQELMNLRLHLQEVLYYTEYNQKYNRIFSDMTFIKSQISNFEKLLKCIQMHQILQLAEQHHKNLQNLMKDMNYFVSYEKLLNLMKIESIMIPVEQWLQQKQLIINYLIRKQNKCNDSTEEEQELISNLVLSEYICYNLQSFCKILNVYKDFNAKKNKILEGPEFKQDKQNLKIIQPKYIEVDKDQLIQSHELMKQNINNKTIQQECLDKLNLYEQYQKQILKYDYISLDQEKQMLSYLIDNQEFINKQIFQQKMEQLINLIISILKDQRIPSYPEKRINYEAPAYSEPDICDDVEEVYIHLDNDIQILKINQQMQDNCKQKLRQFYVLKSYDQLWEAQTKERNKEKNIIYQDLEDASKQGEIYIQQSKEVNLQALNDLDCTIKHLREFEYLQQSCLVNSYGRDRLSLLCLQVYQEMMKEIQRHDSELDSSWLQKAQKYYNQINNDDWRIRQCILQSLLTINKFCWNLELQQQIDYKILKFKVFETDKRVNQLINDKQFQGSLTELYTKTWISKQEKIHDQIKQEIQNLNQLQSQIQNCINVKQRQQLLSDYDTKQIKIQDQLKNIEDIRVIAGIQINFLQDLKSDLLRLETKLDQIRDNLNNIQVDIQYLRGKNIYQMLEIRQNRILYQKQQLDAQNIYIPLFVQEWNYITNQENDNKNRLYTEQILSSGVINQFIWGTDQIKTILLIHGLAGCGKSTSARKVEEFLWQFYSTQKQLQSLIIPIIPIVISLPSLQDPAHLAIEQTLKSDSYNFDDKQILELKQEIDNEKIKLLIILDSYDELQPQYQINLIESNKLNKWGCEKDQDNYPKIILTSRTEALDSDNKYKKFVSDESKLKFYKEIRLINFDDTQIKNYIQEYCKLQAKQILLEQYKEILKQNQQQYEMQNLFNRLWDQIYFKFDISNIYLIDEDQTANIIEIYKKEKMELTLQNQKNLQIQLMEVWSPIQYQKYIDALKLQDILITAFMMEIVIQVLPQMIAEHNNINNIGQKLKLKYKQKQWSQKNDHEIQVLPQMIAEHNNINIGQKLKLKYKQLSQKTDQEIEQIWEQLLNSPNFVKNINISLSEQELQQIIEPCCQNKLEVRFISKSILSQNLTKYDFYQKFYEIYIRKQLNKVINENFNYNEETCFKEILQFATDLAIILSKEELTIITYVPQGYMYKRKQMWQDYFFEDTNDEKLGQLKKIYRKCIPIKQKFNSYQFNHKSLQEFLVARDLYQLLQKLIQSQSYDSNLNIDLLRDHNINQTQWDTDFMNGTVEFIKMKIKSDQLLIQNLQLIVESCNSFPKAYQNLAFIQSKLGQ